MNNSRPLAQPWMVLISTAQGLMLLFLYRSIEEHFWPNDDPVAAFAMWTFAVVAPLLLLLSLDATNHFKATAYSLGVAAVFTVLGAYIGWQVPLLGGEPGFKYQSLTFTFVVTIAIAVFKALMYLQQHVSGLPATYQTLFTLSWRNFLVLAFSGLLVGVFGLLLLLWGWLFDAIGIEFFRELFKNDWFLFPVFAAVFGLGISVFRNLTHVIDSVTKLLYGLLKFLLPLTVVIAVGFLCALAFRGPEVLWSTGHGSSLVLWLVAVILFFINGVYQDGREADQYRTWMHRCVTAGLLSLPILCALSFYGLYQRVQQYGWSIERCWGMAVWALLTLFCAGYLWGVIRRRLQWPVTLASVNKSMGLIMLVFLLLANSPLLDFRKITLKSQLARVESGNLKVEDFDFAYAKRHLVRPGQVQFEAFKAQYPKINPEVIKKITSSSVRGRYKMGYGAFNEFLSKATYVPARFDLPESLVTFMIANETYLPENSEPWLFLKKDLNDDGQVEYIAFTFQGTGVRRAVFYHSDGKFWTKRKLKFSGSARRMQQSNLEKLIEEEIQLAEHPFKILKLGTEEFVPSE